MKYLLAFGFTLLVFFGVNGQTLLKLDEKNGFRDLTFETEVTNISGLKLINNGYPSVYLRPSDELKIGDAKLTEISYGFHDKQLYSVTIRTGDYSNSYALLRALKTAYGEGSQPYEHTHRYDWNGQKVLMIYFRDDKGMAKVTMKSKRLEDLRNAELQKISPSKKEVKGL